MYKIRLYIPNDYDDIIKMIIDSYNYECPVVGLSRQVFCKHIYTNFNNYQNAWENTIGIVEDEQGLKVASVWNEGEYDGNQYFLFCDKKYASDTELLKIMIKFTKTYGAKTLSNRQTKVASLFIQPWNDVLLNLAKESGYAATTYHDECFILPFNNKPFDVKLPDGYYFKRGKDVTLRDVTLVHRHSFSYGEGDLAIDKGINGFSALRSDLYCNPNYTICVYDPNDLPVAFLVGWFIKGMKYAEIEPLAVCWWERRKGIATAIIHELSNIIMEEHPNCTGLRGGDQTFYKKIGFVKMGESICHSWEKEVYISWDPRSEHEDYKNSI